MKEQSRTLFGQMLVADKVITTEQLEEALRIQSDQGKAGTEVKRIGVILGTLGYLDKKTLEEYINKVVLLQF